MVGVTLAKPEARRVTDESLARGVVINAIGDSTLRFLPPLVCTASEVDTLLNVLREVTGE